MIWPNYNISPTWISLFPFVCVPTPSRQRSADTRCFRYALSMKKKLRNASTRGYIPPAISSLNLQVMGIFFRFLFFSTKNRSDRPGRLSELAHRVGRSTNRLSKQLHQGICGVCFDEAVKPLWPPASPDQN